MIDPQERANRKAKAECGRWKRLGGIIYDVQRLLENVARINDYGLSDHNKKHLAFVRVGAALVSSHALTPVLTELNSEYDEHFMKIMETENKEAA